MKKLILTFGIIVCANLFAVQHATAQGVAVNTSGSAADASAIIDVSSNTQGMLVPRMLSTQRTAISSPANGLLVYQTDAPAGFYFYNAGTWQSLSSGAPTGAASGDLTGTYPAPTLTTTGVTASTYGSSTASPVITVDSKGRITSATTAAISNVPGGSASGDLAGSYPAPTLTTTGVTASTYGSSTASPVITVDNKGRVTSATTAAISNVPGGAAGGDLTGTYPSPSLANTAVIAGAYGTATNSPTFTVDAKGRITGVTNNTITGTVPGGAASGDLTGSYPNPSLATTGVTANTYGGATTSPTIVVDAKGRITSASNTTITGTTPGGSAGGNLGGTYPNPSIASLPAISGATLTGITPANLTGSGQIPAAAMPALTTDVTSSAGSTATTIANTATGGTHIVSAINNAGTTGTITPARLGTGTLSSSTFLNGSGAFSAPTASVPNTSLTMITTAGNNGVTGNYYLSPVPTYTPNVNTAITDPTDQRVVVVMPFACTVKALQVASITTIAGVGSVGSDVATFTVMKNGAATSMTTAVTNTQAVGNPTFSSDITHTFTVAAGDRITLRFSESKNDGTNDPFVAYTIFLWTQ